MTITVLLNSEEMPNRSQDQETFDNNNANLYQKLPTWGQQANALAANLNSVAFGGAYAIPYLWGPGINIGAQPSQNATTLLAITNTNAAGVSALPQLQQFDGSNSAVKGTIRIVAQGDASKFIVFNITSRVDNGTYQVVNGAVVQASGTTPFTNGDPVMLSFQRTGDKGDAGSLTPVLWVRDEKSGGTSAGASVAGQQTRTLNTVKKNAISGASVTSNVITLPAGTYRAEASVPAYGVLNHRAFLEVTSGGSTVSIDGTSAFANGGNATNSVINKAEFTIAAGGGTIKVQHLTAQVVATNGLGISTSMGGTEVYTDVFIEKVS